MNIGNSKGKFSKTKDSSSQKDKAIGLSGEYSSHFRVRVRVNQVKIDKKQKIMVGFFGGFALLRLSNCFV